MKEKIIYWLKKIFWPVAVVLMMITLTGCGNSGQGSSIGYIETIDTNNGWIFKDNEVYIKTNLQSSVEDVYCVEDNEVLKQLQAFKDSGEKVNISYNSEIITWPSRCHNMKGNDKNINGYTAFIYKVEKAK
jgi:hypothetical protein